MAASALRRPAGKSCAPFDFGAAFDVDFGHAPECLGTIGTVRKNDVTEVVAGWK